MAAKLKIDGLVSLGWKLDRQAVDGKRQAVTVVCGYATPYAVDVHEDMETPRADGQPKFLEQAARQHQRDMAGVLESAVKAGRTVEQGMVAAGNYLGAVSRPLVPVLTGRLRDSFFVQVVGGSGGPV